MGDIDIGGPGVKAAAAMADNRLAREVVFRSDREAEALAERIRAKRERRVATGYGQVKADSLIEAHHPDKNLYPWVSDEEAVARRLGERPDIEAVQRAAESSGGLPRCGERPECRTACNFGEMSCATCGDQWQPDDKARECSFDPEYHTAPVRFGDGDQCHPVLSADNTLWVCRACGESRLVGAEADCPWDPKLHAPWPHPGSMVRDYRTIASTAEESKARIEAQERIKAARRLTAPVEPSDGEAAPAPPAEPETHDRADGGVWQGVAGEAWAATGLDGDGWPGEGFHPHMFPACWSIGTGQIMRFALPRREASRGGAGSMPPAATGQPPPASERDLLEGIRLSLWCIEGLLRRICNEHGDKLDATARIVARHGAATAKALDRLTEGLTWD